MSIGNVSFGQQVQINQQNERKSTGVLKGTAVAASIGAGALAGLDYISQKDIMKHPNLIINDTHDALERSLAKKVNFLRKYKPKGFQESIERLHKEYNQFYQNCVKYCNSLAASKKIDLKTLGKAGVIGAFAVGGAYLTYRGIKALFTKES